METDFFMMKEWMKYFDFVITGRIMDSWGWIASGWLLPIQSGREGVTRNELKGDAFIYKWLVETGHKMILGEQRKTSAICRDALNPIPIKICTFIHQAKKKFLPLFFPIF